MVLFEKSEKTWLLNFVGEILAKMLILDTFSEPVGVFLTPQLLWIRPFFLELF